MNNTCNPKIIALNELQLVKDYAPKKDFELTEFVIYNEHRDLTNIYDLQEMNRTTTLFWDALISIPREDNQILVKEARFDEISIQYRDDAHGVRILLRSTLDKNVWYWLFSAAKTYDPLYNAFLWKAIFAKHIFSWADVRTDIMLMDFKECFYEWVTEKWNHDKEFCWWLSGMQGKTDFRGVVNACGHFLHNQAKNLNAEVLLGLTFFRDIGHAKNQLEEASLKTESHKQHEKTFVTPTVFRWFKDVFPGRLFLVTQNIDNQSSQSTQASLPSAIRNSNEKSEFRILCHNRCTQLIFLEKNTVMLDQVSFTVGDTVEVYPDEDEADDEPLICILTELKPEGFKLLWLYTRNQTLLKNLDQDLHPQATQELFFTRHAKENHYFCRYYYRHVEGDFLALSEEYLTRLDRLCGCFHVKDEGWYKFVEKYRVGDCILIDPISEDSTKFYTVACIEAFNYQKKSATLRRFLRFHEVREEKWGGINELNELLYSEELVFEFEKFDKPIRPCHVEYFNYSDWLAYYPDNKNPLPINLHIELVTDEKIITRFKPYCQKVSEETKLRGLDLFCGSGSLSRGLEDSQFVECRWAFDKYFEACQTFRQNAKYNNVIVMHESVNKILSDAVKNINPRIPKKGDVEILIAGSPCQGFSTLNRQKGSSKSQVNNSLIASFASFAEYYSPKYLLLENVAPFVKEPVFVKLVACLLEIGYQVKFGLVSGEQIGCPQSRVRTILWGAKQEVVLPDLPPVTHDSGEIYRHHQYTIDLPRGPTIRGITKPEYINFPTITIERAIGKLPRIQTGVLWFPSFPDHRINTFYKNYHRDKEIMKLIPKEPKADYFTALERGLIPEELQVMNSTGSPCCQRINKNGVFSTITTNIRFLDSDIIIGQIEDQYKIIGNAVPKNMAFALGIQLGYALTDPFHRSAWGSQME
ncbi:8022_t:CDS:10 [Ambispora leptoticha]|uniref:DNA (cytosine-5-)-methyltransferase n=1 Tax=Ambispora leptoticha TaxID=144679 RepID=A0A9N9G311_9GLOM|nr:8022_t:CDS:10 [Ambispora leptoticha]